VTDVDETPPLMAFARASSQEEIEALDEAFGENGSFAHAITSELLA
jgi:hypothetical protein